MAAKVVSKEGKRKVALTMQEFGSGKLKSSDGSKVTDRKQALAIAISQGREADKPKGALHGAVVTRRRAPAQFPVAATNITASTGGRRRPSLPATASPTAVAAVAKRPDVVIPPQPQPIPVPLGTTSKRKKRLGGAESGVVVVNPMASNLPNRPEPLPRPEAKATGPSARDMIREGIGELVKEGLWPSYDTIS